MAGYETAIAWGIFGLTYFTLALGYVPFFRLDRTGAVFIGALAATGLGLLTLEESFLALEYRTLLLLFNMMIIVSYFVNSGVFSRILGFLERIENQKRMLWATVLVSGLASAVFINDVVCLVLTPVVADIVLARKWNPLPYLLAVAMASNIGSAMTPIGNPQNMYIASVSGVSWSEFVWRIFPLSALGLVLLGFALLPMLKGGEGGNAPPEHHHHARGRDLARAGAVLAAVLAGFWAGYEAALVTGLGAAFLLLTRHIPRKRIFSLVDWDLLVLFASLFVVMAAADKYGVTARAYGLLEPLGIGTSAGFPAILAALSNFVGNVPAVVFLAPLVERMGGGHESFLLMAAVSTFAGNLTLVGSIANLIVAEKAKAKGITVDFWSYTKAGFGVTLVLCIAAALVL
ncbi:MAG: anion transporter [Nitrospinae bacterium]|nr:anion transporter [Nitrospinota bacterium]